jgi:hypothetical protein
VPSAAPIRPDCSKSALYCHHLPALVGLAFVALAAGGCGSTTGATATVTETVAAAPVTETVTKTVAEAAASDAPVTPGASPRRPVTLSGSGIGVHTADLSAGGYNATWSAESPGGFTAVPVNANGSLDYAPGRLIVPVAATGTVAFQAAGTTTFQIGGSEGPWTLTFTLLS